MQKNQNQYIAAFSIENNCRPGIKVSPLVIGYSRVEEFYQKYRKLPESERTLGKNDIFLYDNIDDALVDHIDKVVMECDPRFFNHD